jgi:hypothetical protein
LQVPNFLDALVARRAALPRIKFAIEALRKAAATLDGSVEQSGRPCRGVSSAGDPGNAVGARFVVFGSPNRAARRKLP